MQPLTGIFIYYGWTIYNTVLSALNEISVQQAQNIEHILKYIQILSYNLATNSKAKLGYNASDMQFHVDSGAAHFVSDQAKSKASKSKWHVSNLLFIDSVATNRTKIRGQK